jgi:uncharacterized membrane protein (UPF0127 family)
MPAAERLRSAAMRSPALLAVVLLLAPSACAGERAQPKAAPPAPSADAKTSGEPAQSAARVVIGEHSFRVELARTPPERSRGLMYRDHMDEDAGMLFLFERMRTQSFWMKNTRIPLDMLFIDDTGVIVGIVENAEPMTLTSRSVGKPSQYVLELNGGTCRRLGIKAGQLTRFVGVPGHPVRGAGPVR